MALVVGKTCASAACAAWAAWAAPARPTLDIRQQTTLQKGPRFSAHQFAAGFISSLGRASVSGSDLRSWCMWGGARTRGAGASGRASLRKRRRRSLGARQPPLAQVT